MKDACMGKHVHEAVCQQALAVVRGTDLSGSLLTAVQKSAMSGSSAAHGPAGLGPLESVQAQTFQRMGGTGVAFPVSFAFPVASLQIITKILVASFIMSLKMGTPQLSFITKDKEPFNGRTPNSLAL